MREARYVSLIPRTTLHSDREQYLYQLQPFKIRLSPHFPPKIHQSINQKPRSESVHPKIGVTHVTTASLFYVTHPSYLRMPPRAEHVTARSPSSPHEKNLEVITLSRRAVSFYLTQIYQQI
jgi:hypothetical protein